MTEFNVFGKLEFLLFIQRKKPETWRFRHVQMGSTDFASLPACISLGL